MMLDKYYEKLILLLVFTLIIYGMIIFLQDDANFTKQKPQKMYINALGITGKIQLN